MHEIKMDDMTLTWFGHASFLIDAGKKIYIDPHVLPAKTEKADIILVTHEHFDHCNVENIKKLRKDDTEVIGPRGVINKLGFGSTIAPNKTVTLGRIIITATEAYNINKFRAPGQPFHPHGLGVGFVIDAGSRIYHAGDTDNIREMASLHDIDMALLPIGGTYAMTLNEAAEAAKSFKPRMLVPMHYNSDKYGVSGINADPEELARALAGKGIVVNILEPMV